jgi:hypothetical protein
MNMRTIRVALCGVLLLGCAACAVAPAPGATTYYGDPYADYGAAYSDVYYPGYY